MFIYEIMYDLSAISLPANAIFYIVAASALLSKLNSTIRKLNTTIETKKSTFFAYKLIFSLILLESLLLVIFLEGFKQQIGVLIWIIYVSALMVLFLIFLALTISDSFFSYKRKTEGSFNSAQLLLGNSKTFNFSIYSFFFFLFSLIAVELVEVITVREFVGPLLNGGYNYKLTDSSTNLIDSNNIFNVLKRDISNSPSHYILSAALQAVCLVVVISALIF